MLISWTVLIQESPWVPKDIIMSKEFKVWLNKSLYKTDFPETVVNVFLIPAIVKSRESLRPEQVEKTLNLR